MQVMICYDVMNDRRRARVAKLLEGWGRRVQRSVFECEVSSKEYRELSAKLSRLIKPSEDCVRLVALCADCQARVIAMGAEMEEEFAKIVIV